MEFVSGMEKVSHSEITNLSGQPPLSPRQHNIEELLRSRHRRDILPLSLHLVGYGEGVVQYRGFPLRTKSQLSIRLVEFASGARVLR